jgi:metal-sulfur cluster biosynthetic enzyme
VTNAINGEACSCNPENRACKATTRLNVLLPDLPGIGVWRLESHGWNAAMELPSATDMIARVRDKGSDLPGVLRLEQRTSKKDGKTMRYAVPVIDLNVTVAELMSGRKPVGELDAVVTVEIDEVVEDEPRDVLSASEIAKLLLEAGKLGASEQVVNTIAATTLACPLNDVLRSDKATLWNAVKSAMATKVEFEQSKAGVDSLIEGLAREFDAERED